MSSLVKANQESLPRPQVPVRQIPVYMVDGVPMVSSLQVAEHFEKNHKDVLRAIKNLLQAIERLENLEEFNRLNFAPVEYEDKKGEKRPMYLMTRDGFTLLAMGFTGKKAMEWKVRYIEAFNAMEARLQDISQVKEQVVSEIIEVLEQGIFQSVSAAINKNLEHLFISVIDPMKKDVDALKRTLMPAYPFRLYSFNDRIYRFVVKKGHLALWAQDYVREFDTVSSAPQLLYSLGFRSEEDFVVEGILEAAEEYGIRPKEFLNQLKIDTSVRYFTYITTSGINIISRLHSDFYKFICAKVFPEFPKMVEEYNQIRRSLGIEHKNGREV